MDATSEKIAIFLTRLGSRFLILLILCPSCLKGNGLFYEFLWSATKSGIAASLILQQSRKIN